MLRKELPAGSDYDDCERYGLKTLEIPGAFS